MKRICSPKPLTGALLLICMLAGILTVQPASATIIGLDRLLGTVEPGTPASEDNELEMLNFLLSAYNAGAPTGAALGDNPTDPNPEKKPESYYLLFSTPTFIPDPGSAPAVTSWEAGFLEVSALDIGTRSYDWMGAKYGNNTAFFYIGGLSGIFSLPDTGVNLFSVPTLEGGLSHTTFFTSTSTSVPDGGVTIALLGMGMLGIALLKRRLG